jgi:hypothetical protein
LTFCLARPYSYEPGQALIGAALSRKYGACRVAGPRKAKGRFQIEVEPAPRRIATFNKDFLLIISMKNKKGISAMLSYVLLVIVTIVVSGIVYTSLKLDVPQELAECNPETSLIIERASCNTNENITTLRIHNDGLFNIDGIFVRFSQKNRTVRQQLNPGNETFPPHGISDGSLKPGESFQANYKIESFLVPGETNYTLEVQPAKIEDGKIIPCRDMIIARGLTCDDVPTGPSCVSNEDPEVSCNDGEDNDCNGLRDCDDPNCSDEPICCEANPLGEICGDEEDNDCDGKIDCDDFDCWASDPSCDPWEGCQIKGNIVDPGDYDGDDTRIYMGMSRETYCFGGCIDYYDSPEGWFFDWAAGYAIGYDETEDMLYIVGAALNDAPFWINYSLVTYKINASSLDPELFTLSHQVWSQDDGNYVPCTSGYYPYNTPVDVYMGRWAGSLAGEMKFRAESTPYVCNPTNDFWLASSWGDNYDSPGGNHAKIVEFEISDRPTVTQQIGEWSVIPPSSLGIGSGSVLRKDWSYSSARKNENPPPSYSIKSNPHPGTWEDWDGSISSGYDTFTGPSATINGLTAYVEMTRPEGSMGLLDNDKLIVNGVELFDHDSSAEQGGFEAYVQGGMAAGNIWAVETLTPSDVGHPKDHAIYFVALDESNQPFMLNVEGLTTDPSHPGMWHPQNLLPGKYTTKPIILQNNKGGFMITFQGDDPYHSFGEGVPYQKVYFYKWKNIEDYREGLVLGNSFNTTQMNFDKIGMGVAYVEEKNQFYFVNRHPLPNGDHYGLLNLSAVVCEEPN